MQFDFPGMCLVVNKYFIIRPLCLCAHRQVVDFFELNIGTSGLWSVSTVTSGCSSMYISNLEHDQAMPSDFEATSL